MFTVKIHEEGAGDLEAETFDVRYQANVAFKEKTLAYSNQTGRYEISLKEDSGEEILSTKVGLGW
ncbi:hypothetical protein GLW07_18715 [Bacillus hwajinpoensis]|uniref:Uncharacterized protein n=1 Tax=Guptibacillus hwajinpoensis TaxID=208199 RepID=A0A845F409_9BACL|nr:hypothetical protein [Pseudalkalibacillus hwajinpoensis]MYL65395.1 hypothetical protein [Pseudalkalibacillus hwajinpoensis]